MGDGRVGLQERFPVSRAEEEDSARVCVCRCPRGGARDRAGSQGARGRRPAGDMSLGARSGGAGGVDRLMVRGAPRGASLGLWSPLFWPPLPARPVLLPRGEPNEEERELSAHSGACDVSSSSSSASCRPHLF